MIQPFPQEQPPATIDLSSLYTKNWCLELVPWNTNQCLGTKRNTILRKSFGVHLLCGEHIFISRDRFDVVIRDLEPAGDEQYFVYQGFIRILNISETTIYWKMHSSSVLCSWCVWALRAEQRAWKPIHLMETSWLWDTQQRWSGWCENRRWIHAGCFTRAFCKRVSSPGGADDRFPRGGVPRQRSKQPIPTCFPAIPHASQHLDPVNNTSAVLRSGRHVCGPVRLPALGIYPDPLGPYNTTPGSPSRYPPQFQRNQFIVTASFIVSSQIFSESPTLHPLAIWFTDSL